MLCSATALEQILASNNADYVIVGSPPIRVWATVLPDAVADSDANVSATASRLLDERNTGDAIEQIGTLLHHADPGQNTDAARVVTN